MMTTATIRDVIAITRRRIMTVNAHGRVHHLEAHGDHSPQLRVSLGLRRLTSKKFSVNTSVMKRNHVRRVRPPMDGVWTAVENVHGHMTERLYPLAVRLRHVAIILLMVIKITILAATHGEGRFYFLL